MGPELCRYDKDMAVVVAVFATYPPALLHTVCFGDIDPRVLPFEREQHGEGPCRYGPPSSIETVESGAHESQSQLGKKVASLHPHQFRILH